MMLLMMRVRMMSVMFLMIMVMMLRNSQAAEKLCRWSWYWRKNLFGGRRPSHSSCFTTEVFLDKVTKDWWWIEVFRPAFVQAQAFIKRVVGKAENIAFSSSLAPSYFQWRPNYPYLALLHLNRLEVILNRRRQVWCYLLVNHHLKSFGFISILFQFYF